MELQDIQKEILILCVDDDTGLWLILKRVAKDAYSLDKLPNWVRPKTLEIIRDLLQRGLIEAGNFEHDNAGNYRFRPILLEGDKVINYLETEWDKLGKIPNLGDVCWFRATSAGKQLAYEFGLSA